jgi:hypothetical protein
MIIYILGVLLILTIVYCSRRTKENFENTNDVDECIDEDNKIVQLKPKPKPTVKSKPKPKPTVKSKPKPTVKSKPKPKIKSKPKPKPISKPKPKPKYTNKEEVFLIYNKLNYSDARDICKSYGGRLATESDLETAFKNGANWCNWGWIEGQKIAYPVQEKYWEDIEKTHKGHCGPTAGINKIGNIDTLKKYSVTCYGIKPSKNKLAMDLDSSLPKSSKDDSLEEKIKKCKMSKKKDEDKKKVEELKKKVRIVNFNKQKWSLVQNK